MTRSATYAERTRHGWLVAGPSVHRLLSCCVSRIGEEYQRTRDMSDRKPTPCNFTSSLRRQFSKNYSVSQKNIPPEDLWQFFQNGWEFFNEVLQAYYAFLPTIDYGLLLNYLQLWRSYAILSVTTQFTSCTQNVHRPKRMLAFSDIFPKQLGIFSPNFACLLYVPIYARLHIFI